MKKLLIVFLALGALSFVPSAEARCKQKQCKKQPVSCKTPQCETTESRETVYEPCYKWVKVKGTCPHEILTTVKTCKEESKKCVGPCNAECSNGVTASDRGETDNDNDNE